MNLRFVFALAALMPACPAALAEETRPSASLDHVALHVRDLNGSTAFYKDLFGFGEVKAPFPTARWLVMGGGLTLHIVSGRTEPLTNTKWDHFAISCADLRKMIADLDAKKIAWTDIQGKHEPQVRPDGVQQIFIRDPDGYWIEINDALKSR
ncbi:MAG: VOC family protein [Sphingobium sp.]|nr:VOC family protein [Sphingobium sp.]